MRTVLALAAAAIAALVVAAPAAHAQPDQQQKTAAEAAFRQAKDELKAGKIAEACASFEKSQSLDPQLGTRYNLALCYEKLGRIASAWGIYTELAATDTNAGRKKDAAKREKALAPRLVRVLIVVREATPGLKITRSGADITAAVGVATPVDPGMERLTAEAPGYEPWTSEISMAGEGTTITVEIPPLVKKPEPPPVEEVRPPPDVVLPPPPPPATPPPPGRTRRIVGVTLGVVGLAAIGGGVALGMSAQTANDDAIDACGGDIRDCRGGTLEAQGLVDKARSRALFSTIAFAAGGVAVAGGLVLYLTAPSGDGGARDVAITPVIGPDAVGVSARGAF